MSEPRMDLDSLIESVAEGQEVDWEAARSDAADRERRLLEQLRILAEIGSFAKNPVAGMRPALNAGEPWGSFELLERLGQGASGEVWRARDIHLDREVALKLLTDLSGAAQHSSGDELLHEGRLLSRVRHPNVVTVYGADRHEGRIGLWMECINGQTLAEQLGETGPFGANEAARIGADLCRALAAIHGAGLVHRDVKAQNVMREADGRTVLMDLGIGVDVRRSRPGEPSAGTPLYLAPEIFAGRMASAASDLYSVGVLLFNLVSQTYPVRGETLDDVACAHERQERLSIRHVRPELPAQFLDVIERALESDPLRRFESAQEMECALVTSLDTDSRSMGANGPLSIKRRPGIAVSLAAFVVLAILAWWAVAGRGWVLSLQSTIPFTQRDTVLIAAFENHTGDPTLNGTLERALAHELRQSPHVVVASVQRIDNTLRLMGRPVSTPPNRSIAREAALRDGGIRLVLAGFAEKVAGTYVLTVEAIEPAQGTVRQSLREEADSPASIVRAIGRLAGRIRTALGEPPGSVEVAQRQLEKVTTPSLQALKLYSEAYEAGNRELWAQSESLVRAALEIEPEFPSALNWLGWSMHRQEKRREQWLPYFERALQLADRTTDRERYFIAGSYFGHIGDFDRSIDAYQSLVRLHPDHAWGVNNLIVLLHSAGRRLEISDLLEELVEARPDDMELVARAGVEALAAKGLNAARTYVARARSSAGHAAGRGSGMAFHSLWLELFDAHEDWLAGHPHEASRRLAAAMSSESAASASPDTRNNVAGFFHMALGQVNDAETAFERISDTPTRMFGLALVDLIRGDAPEVARHLATYEGSDGFAAVLLSKAGYHRQAREVLTRIRRSDPTGTAPAWDALRAEIDPSLPPAARIAALRRVVEDLPVGWDTARYYLHAETLASLLAESGDPDGALRVLETASTFRERAHRDPVHIGYFWIHLQKQLADVYRREGRTADAERIEADLLRMLGTADADFPTLVELQARRAPAPTR